MARKTKAELELELEELKALVDEGLVDKVQELEQQTVLLTETKDKLEKQVKSSKASATRYKNKAEKLNTKVIALTDAVKVSENDIKVAESLVAEKEKENKQIVKDCQALEKELKTLEDAYAKNNTLLINAKLKLANSTCNEVLEKENIWEKIRKYFKAFTDKQGYKTSVVVYCIIVGLFILNMFLASEGAGAFAQSITKSISVGVAVNVITMLTYVTLFILVLGKIRNWWKS